MSIRLENFLKKESVIYDTNTEFIENEAFESIRFPSDDDYYNEEIPDYLINSPELVGYPDAEMQEDIYQWVKESLPLHNFSVKDLGCGRGDFYDVISKNLFDDVVGVQYFGIEFRKSLIESGRKKYPEIQLINNDFLEVDLQTDYSICIGTLNDRHSEDKWEYFNKILKYALSNTNKAIIFVLSSNSDDVDSFFDYPLDELFANLPSHFPCQVDYSKFQDIYKLTVHIGSFN